MIKICRCHRTYTRESWDALPLVGIQHVDEGLDLELRNCGCGSTIAIELVDPEADTLPSSALTVAA